MARKKIPQKIADQVLLQSRRRCCICFGLNNDIEEKPGLDQDNANSDIDNLAWMCLAHHDEYDSKTSQTRKLSIGEAKQYRTELYEAMKDPANRQGPSAEPSIEVISHNQSGGITAQTVNQGHTPELAGETLRFNELDPETGDYVTDIILRIICPYAVGFSVRVTAQSIKTMALTPHPPVGAFEIMKPVREGNTITHYYRNARGSFLLRIVTAELEPDLKPQPKFHM